MKNLLMKFADQILSKDELKRVKGGDNPYGGGGGCGLCYVQGAGRSCSSFYGQCVCSVPGGSPCGGPG